MASNGWSVPLRRSDGRIAGRIQAYSALNVDAARAARHKQPDLARRLAAGAAELETSPAGMVIHDAITRASERLAAHLAGHVSDDAWSDRLSRYLALRQGVGWEGLDRDALARDWLVHSEAWLHLDPKETDQLVTSVRRLAAAAQLVREELFAGQGLALDSFTGVVRHIDPDNAQIVSEAGDAWVISRRELDREGLAQLGEAVTVFREELPGGGEAWLAAPAVRFSPLSPPGPRGAHNIDPFAGPVAWVMGEDESRWLSRALKRDPFMLVRTPVVLGPDR